MYSLESHPTSTLHYDGEQEMTGGEEPPKKLTRRFKTKPRNKGNTYLWEEDEPVAIHTCVMEREVKRDYKKIIELMCTAKEQNEVDSIVRPEGGRVFRSEEHTSELQSQR